MQEKKWIKNTHIIEIQLKDGNWLFVSKLKRPYLWVQNLCDLDTEDNTNKLTDEEEELIMG